MRAFREICLSLLAIRPSHSSGASSRFGLGKVVVLVEAGHDAQISATLGAVVLGLATQDAAALVHGVPAEIATERWTVTHGGRVPGPLSLQSL